MKSIAARCTCLALAGVLTAGCSSTGEPPKGPAFRPLGTGNVLPVVDEPVQQAPAFRPLGIGNVAPIVDEPAQRASADKDCQLDFPRPGVGPVGAEPVLRCRHDPRQGPNPGGPVLQGCGHGVVFAGRALGPIGLPVALIGLIGVCLPIAATVGIVHAIAFPKEEK